MSSIAPQEARRNPWTFFPAAGGHLVSLLGTTDASVGWDVGEYLDQSSRVQAVIAIAAVTDLTQNFPNADIEADGAAEPGLEQIYQIISDFLAKYLPQ